MLMTLPVTGPVAIERLVETPTRRAVAASSLAAHGMQSDAMLINTVIAAGLACSLVLSMWTASLNPLVGLAVVGSPTATVR